jgi:hypothetical protein
MDQVRANLSKQDPDHPVMRGLLFAGSNRDKVTRIRWGALTKKPASLRAFSFIGLPYQPR